MLYMTVGCFWRPSKFLKASAKTIINVLAPLKISEGKRADNYKCLSYILE
jgi:hypothetical protein